MFIARSVKKILSLAPKKNTELRDACNLLIADIDAQFRDVGGMDESQSRGESRYILQDEEAPTLLLFRPFVLACQTKSTKIVEEALSCLQKLIENGYVRGTVRVDLYGPVTTTKGPTRRQHIDLIVNTICKCFEEDVVPEDIVQVHIIKALLTAVCAVRHPVHDAALISAVRTCYYIHLISRKEENQNAAKSALTQMAKTILKRMEAEVQEKAAKQSQDTTSSTNAEQSSTDAVVETIDSIGDDSTTISNAPKGKWDASFIPGKFAVHVDVEQREGGGNVVFVKGTITIAGESIESFDSGKQQRFCQLLATSSEAPLSNVQVSSTADAQDVEGLVIKFAIATDGVEHAGDMQMKLLEAVSDEGHMFHGRSTDQSDHATDSKNILVYQRDVFLLFRTLCKISTRPADPAYDYQLEMRSKVLSLELLQILLRDAGASFFDFDRLVPAVRAHLMTSLLRNVTCSHNLVFRLCIEVFYILTNRLRHKLKTEIQIFFDNIFLRTLHSPHVSFDQKLCVLEVVQLMLKDPQWIVDMFVNYDCEMESVDLFERLVNALSKSALNNHTTDHGYTPAQDQRIRAIALENLDVILISLYAWSKKRKESSTPGGSETEEQMSLAGDGEQSLPEDAAGNEVHLGKEKKVERAKAIAKFNIGAKEAISMLIDSGAIENTPESIANFLRTAPGLNKKVLGLYIGKNSEWNVQVMHRFVESFNFANLSFDESLRRFLEAFWLPGEAQVVDRIMEKFGEVFIKQNNHSHLKNPDTAFVLSFSTLMLNTDLHNPNIKTKMTKAQFIQMNRGINKTSDGEDAGDLDYNFLSDLYDCIQRDEIKVLKDVGVQMVAASDATVNPKQRQSLFVKETELMMKRTEEIFKQTKSRKHQKHIDTFIVSTEIEHARLIFGVCWCPMLAAFSLVLEKNDDFSVVKSALEGVSTSIHLSSMFLLETERDAFVSCLSKLTNLHAAREITVKNIEAIRALLDVAKEDGNYLHESWYEVLRSLSQLQKLHLLNTGAHADSDFLTDDFVSGTPAYSAPDTLSEMGRTKSKGGLGMSLGFNMFSSRNAAEIQREEERAIEEHKAIAIGENISDSEIDQIFLSSQHLQSNAVVSFVEALCRVAKEELEAPMPRVFCLQKIVETSYFNMGIRGRLVWRKIWESESKLFVSAVCHRNKKVAMYALDSLKQLSQKFLEKEELGNYQFQKDFLKPFEVVMIENTNSDIRELVLRCVENMILCRVKNIRSGWKIILGICSFVGATVQNDTLVNLAFDIVCRITSQYLELIHDFFVDQINCLISFTSSKPKMDVSLRAIDLVRQCAAELARGSIAGVPAQRVVDGDAEGEGDNHEIYIKMWFPILTGLSRAVSSDPRIEVRTRAMEVLFEIARTHGQSFSAHFWGLTFRGVLFPMFDDVSYVGADAEKDRSWLQTTCVGALRSLVTLFIEYFHKLSFMLPELLNLLMLCIMQVSEHLSKTGFGCLSELVSKTGSNFSDSMWLLFVNTTKDLFDRNTPFRLTQAAPTQDSPAAEGAETKTKERSRSGSGIIENGSPSKVVAQDVERAAQSSDVDSVHEDQHHDGSVGVNQHGDLEGQFDRVRSKCLVQFELIKCIGDVCQQFHQTLPTHHLTVLLDLIQSSYNYASAFNKDIALRIALQKAGLLRNLPNQLPSLLRQEAKALATYVRVCFTVYMQNPESGFAPTLEWRFVSMVHHVLAAYIEKESNVASIPTTDRDIVRAEQHRELMAWNEIVIDILHMLDSLPRPVLGRHLPSFLEPFIHLMACESRDVREVLRDFLLKQTKAGRIVAVVGN